ncbi:MAG: prepilin peptidase [Coriobacteriales bacterium]|jgi:leader peptidase (prepilin peptidase)/N-methyltransferase|nr:prepilin peptidase [Coriobacteriales bacterium]
MELALNIVLLILVFALGVTIGSFLNVVIYRLPQKLNFVSGRSFCPHCNHQLSALDLVPVLSYLGLGRKCRYCKEPISPRYMVVEALTGVLALVSYLAFLPPVGFLLEGGLESLYTGTAVEVGLMAAWLPFALPAFSGAIIAAVMAFFVLCLLVVVTYIDADTMEIPNSLSLWLAALGLLSFAFGPTAALPWYDHLIGAVCVSVPMCILAFALVGSFGLGDVKLMAAAGLVLGWQLTLVATFIAVLVGGAWGIFLLATRRKGRKDHFAFGPALCAGIAASLFAGHPLITWYLGFF